MNVELKIPGTNKSITVKETLVDMAVRYVNPIRGQQRLRARAMTALASGGYIGASKSRRALSGWTTCSNDADTAALMDLPTLRERSRDLVRNAPIATGALNTVCTNVVGTGLKLQPSIDRDVLNLTEEQANAWEASAGREFRLFANTQACDATRTQNFAGLQDLVFRSTLESGDTFILLPYIKRLGSPYELKLQVIEADRVSNKDRKGDTGTIAGGVEKDSNGAPRAYHIQDQHPGNMYSIGKSTWKTAPAFGKKTGRRNVLHLFKVLRPGQTRGVPYFAPVIELLKQLSRYTEAELMATVVSSFFTVFVKSEGAASLSPMDPTSETGGTTSDEDYKLASGAIVALGSGESIETANPGRPNPAFDPFVTAILREMGVALELPFEILVKHFTSSYSAARAALLEAWKFFNGRRTWLADNFCQPVYEAFMDEAVATGRILAPGYFDDPLIRKAYLGSEWVGPAKGMIDEKKEVEAAKERVGMGISTLAEETAQLTGGDWEKKHPQRVKEHNMRKEAGLLETKAAVPAPPPQEDDPDKEDEDEK